MSDKNYLTLGELARRFGCQLWQVRRLYERGLLPPAKRIGQYRVVDERDLGTVQRALLAAGYIEQRVGA
jgi:DNA-binding transcriptional MerR regulator